MNRNLVWSVCLIPLALGQVGCNAERSTGIILQPAESATVRVVGTDPLVRIETPMEGELAVTVRNGEKTFPPQRLQGICEYHFRGPSEYVLENPGPARVTVMVTATSADALTVERRKPGKN